MPFKDKEKARQYYREYRRRQRRSVQPSNGDVQPSVQPDGVQPSATSVQPDVQPCVQPSATNVQPSFEFEIDPFSFWDIPSRGIGKGAIQNTVEEEAEAEDA